MSIGRSIDGRHETLLAGNPTAGALVEWAFAELLPGADRHDVLEQARDARRRTGRGLHAARTFAAASPRLPILSQSLRLIHLDARDRARRRRSAGSPTRPPP